MKKLSCALLLMLPLTVWAYPIEMDANVSNTDVTYDTQELNYNMGAVLVRNHGTTAARCTATFRNGPEAPRTRRTLIASGAEANMTAKFTREILRLRIQLNCEPEV